MSDGVPGALLGDHRGGSPVLVGLADAPLESSHAALRFAAQEANRRRRDVVVVHGTEPLTTISSPAPTLSLSTRQHRGQQLIAEARDMLTPQLDAGRSVQGWVSDRTGADALVELSEAACLLVLQRRDVGAVVRLHTGSTTSRVCARAAAPVAVIRADHDEDRGRRGVVVGVDGRGHAAAAIEVALDEAALRREVLTAVYAWQRPGPSVAYGYVPPDVEELAALRSRAQAELSESLAGWASVQPDVVVDRRAVEGPAGEVLVAMSGTAQLLVLGRHGRHGVASIGLGSVARSCLQRAQCPVVVTPTSRPAQHRRWLGAEVPIQTQF